MEDLGFCRSTSGFANNLGANLIGHFRFVGGLFYDFYWYLLPFGRNRHLYKPEMDDLGFWGPTSGFGKNLGAHLIGHPRLVGGLFYDFYWYLLPFGRNGHLYKPEMEDFGFWGPTSGVTKNLGAHLIGHLRFEGGLFYDFYWYLKPFGSYNQFYKPEIP